MTVCPSSSIPQFSLYGEQENGNSLESIHVEDIYERSSRHNWIISPHRHPHLYQVLVISRGSVEMQLDEASYKLQGAWSVMVPPGIVHGFRFQPDTQGQVMSLAAGMNIPGSDNQLVSLLHGTMNQPVVTPQHKQHGQLALDYMAQIKRELAAPKEHHDLALSILAKLVLIELSRQISNHHRAEGLDRSGMLLVDRYRQMVERSYQQHRHIVEYADALNVSLSTLNRACHHYMGMSAKQFLQVRLHIEAKRRLMYTHETLEQIAYVLGYSDPAYFSRAFKMREGIPPGKFRQNCISSSRVRRSDHDSGRQ